MIESYKHILESEFLNVMSNLDTQSLLDSKKLIKDAESVGGRVHITGIGKPSYVAGYIASLLSSTGTPCYVLHGTEAVHGSAGQVLPQDVVIAVSNSGETSELRYTIETIKNLGAKVIGVSGNETSWLAKESHVHILAKVSHEGDDLNKAPRASIVAEIIVLQALSILLQEEVGLDAQTYLKWHPGGALGASIREKNND